MSNNGSVHRYDSEHNGSNNLQRFSAPLDGQASSWPADFFKLYRKRLKSRRCMRRQDSTSEQDTGSGGEGGIRTPGTGFSQYNGLAKKCPFHSLVFGIRGLQLGDKSNFGAKRASLGAFVQPVCNQNPDGPLEAPHWLSIG